jgi:hypothetical protein
MTVGGSTSVRGSGIARALGPSVLVALLSPAFAGIVLASGQPAPVTSLPRSVETPAAPSVAVGAARVVGAPRLRTSSHLRVSRPAARLVRAVSVARVPAVAVPRVATPRGAVSVAAPATPAGPCDIATDRVVPVSTAAELKAALAAANPGDRISLADGVYGGASFALTRSGTATNRIHVCGRSGAVLDFGSTSRGVGLWLRASYVDLVGFTVTNAQKGIVTDRSSYDVFDQLTVFHIGDEGIHLRTNSHDIQVTNSVIHDTGLHSASNGEGVYVGSAANNWCTYTSCNPDHSDNNVVQGNRFWKNGAEAVDVKEGTAGGTVADNTFDGTGSGALSWVDIKGNNWVIRSNNGRVAQRDGFLTEVAMQGWGKDNTFQSNTADVQGPGYGLRVAARNVVACNNVVTDAAKGYSNVACTA